jgi:hypothetical protein
MVIWFGLALCNPWVGLVDGRNRTEVLDQHKPSLFRAATFATNLHHYRLSKRASYITSTMPKDHLLLLLLGLSKISKYLLL